MTHPLKSRPILLVSIALLPLLAHTLWAGPLTDKGTQPPLSQELKKPSDCRSCHGNFDQTRHTEPFPVWSGSMMAQASRDPVFWAQLDVANNDLADAGDFCLRCHVPMGWLNERSEPPLGSTDGCGFLGKLDERDKDFEGVFCHQCHRMYVNPAPPQGEDAVYFENGQFWIDDSNNCSTGGGEPCRRGPYTYPQDGTDPPPHAWIQSDYHENSDICGNCHNVTNPVRNLIVNGVDQGIRAPIERTFMEWQQSDYNVAGPTFRTCQNCHMPDDTNNPAFVCDSRKNNHSGDAPLHEFAGGNTWVPDVLRQEYPRLELSNEFIATRDWAIEMLQSAATIAVTAPTSVREGSALEVSVRVTNETGHKLPTGYPEGRRMWINVRAEDGLGALIWESGHYDSSTGVLDDDDQIKVYHVEPGIWNYNGTGECDIVDELGRPMFHFVLNNCVKVDNRIPPRGFTGGTDIQTRPVSYTFPETSPGSGILVNYDTTSYSIPIPVDTPSPVTVTARLQYQSTSKELVEFALNESVENGFANDCIPRDSGTPTQTRGEILHEMWTTYGKAPPQEMTFDSTLVTIDSGPSFTPGESSGGSLGLMIASAYDLQTGAITIEFDPGCVTTDHTIYYGDLASVASMIFSGQECHVGTTGSATFTPGPGSIFWLIVGNDGAVEGSYGVDSEGTERPEDIALTECALPQDLVDRCD